MRFWNCRWTAILAAVFIAFPSATAAGAAGPDTAGHFVPGRVILKPKPHVSAANVLASVATDEVQTVSEIPQLGYTILSVPAGQELDWAQRLAGNPLVENAQLDYVYNVLIEPNDYFYTHNYQWNLPDVNAPAAWDISTGSPDFVIAIADTGIDDRHDDLAGKVIAKVDYINESDLYDGLGFHGTHVAGIAAANTNNLNDTRNIWPPGGIAGMSWQAKLMDVKVADHNGKAPDSAAAQGIIYAADHGAKIINLSFGGEDKSGFLQDAINYAFNKGVLIVAASGNCADPNTYWQQDCKTVNPPIYPAADDNVLAVGAINAQHQRSTFSEYGSYVSVVAPGEAIVSTAPNQQFITAKGTSQAAPHVAALANLIWSVNPNLTTVQVTNIITSTARDLGPAGKDDEYGYGEINAYAALAKAEMVVTPAQTGFLAPITGASTVTNTLNISSLGTGFSWTASANPEATWLSVSPSSGTAPSSATLSVNRGSLGAGHYEASVTVQVSGAEKATYTVPVELTVASGIHKVFIPTVTRLSAAGW